MFPDYLSVSCDYELSKVAMYEFIQNKYDNKSKLLFINTESLMYGTEVKMFMTILVRICWIKAKNVLDSNERF